MIGRPRTGRAHVIASATILLVLGGCSGGTSQAAPTPTTTPSLTQGASDTAPQWLGPVRSAKLRVISRQKALHWVDPRDAAFDGIDLRLVAGRGREYNGVAVINGKNVPGFSAGGWHAELVARPPRTATIDPDERVIEYGVVIDTDGDRTADCHIGINNDARQRGRWPVYRVWVKNLRTRETVEQVGGPYGGLVEFGHPGDLGSGRGVGFEFLGDWMSPCRKAGPAATFYAYAVLTENGEVTSWDFAPDAAWLPMQCGKACHEIGEQ